ncbi:MAG: glutathione S-transferase [Kangiellaceae bacterium]
MTDLQLGDNKTSNISGVAAKSEPILYTFRRCPYAMRARLAIQSSGAAIEYREILLRDKPKAMLDVSPKGTVPVLVKQSGNVVDESLDIMLWALQKRDPSNLLNVESLNDAKHLIAINDDLFKPKLDLYKYSIRYPERSKIEYREDCLFFLRQLNNYLLQNKYLLGDKLSLADIAIFPFIRQFAFVDKTWFDSTEFIELNRWLQKNLDSTLFKKIMLKRDVWRL